MNQITKILSRDAWKDIVIKESGEPLVELVETDNLRLGYIQKSYEVKFFVRKSVRDLLNKASGSLPENLALVVVEGWRSMEHQQKSWDAKWKIFKDNHPDWTDEQIEKEVKLIVARPNPLANHHCGGAVDVVLMNKQTCDLVEMGTPYPYDHMPANITKLFPMYYPNIEPVARENRKILREAMQLAGFVYYPGEWWHYCYGDRMWAVYTEQKECIYGPIKL